MSFRRRLAPLLVALALPGCGVMAGPVDGGAVVDGGTEPDGGLLAFIAFARDFEGFEAWQHVEVTDDAAGTGRRTMYRSNGTPAGSSYPVGTRIVKVMEDPDVPGRITIHAMAKRGNGFNGAEGGALGWEWFELLRTTSGGLSIDWRGIAPPPDGGGYGKAFGGQCNACHGLYSDISDSLLTPGFEPGAP